LRIARIGFEYLRRLKLPCIHLRLRCAFSRSRSSHVEAPRGLDQRLEQGRSRKRNSPAWTQFERDRLNGVWIPVDSPERIWETSIDLARKHGPTLGVRTLDSLHVACALELKAQRFWTFDDRQARLAEAVGLNTNP
jgi:predicted nucleic acid-binding protein